MDSLEKFNKNLLELVSKSNLPASAISICFNNILLQIEVSKLQNIITSQQINKEDNKKEIKEITEKINEKKEIVKKNKPQSGGGGCSPSILVNKDNTEENTTESQTS